MFRPKRTQKSIFDHDVYLPEDKVAALEKTWAGPFRREILPLIDEESFRPLYCQDNGRPNVPVALMTGLCILKEHFNLTDQSLLGSLEFDLRWQYAFDINNLESHICQKTLHNFRVLVTTNNKAREIFTGVTDKIIQKSELSTEKQRLDSTHIVSNMTNLSRLGLFVRTIEGFLKRVEKKHPNVYKKLPALYDKAYVKRSGYFADVKSSMARRRLEKCARHLFDLVDRFKGHKQISRMKAYRLMVRLLEEQCEIKLDNEQEKVILKAPKNISSESLQNPSDPDATYGRKGKGYKASLTETCVKENPLQVITDVSVDGAHASDQKDVIPVIERLEESGHKPNELYADAGYGNGENIVQGRDRDVDLTAPVTMGKTPDEGKMQLSDFDVTEDYSRVTGCLQNRAPVKCRFHKNSDIVEAFFSADHCKGCELLPLCLVKRHKKSRYRLRYRRRKMAASSRRQEQETKDFKERYKIRSGIEATVSEADRITGLKRSWTRGMDRIRSSVYFKALAINIKRYIKTKLIEAKKDEYLYALTALYGSICLLLNQLYRLRRRFFPYGIGLTA